MTLLKDVLVPVDLMMQASTRMYTAVLVLVRAAEYMYGVQHVRVASPDSVSQESIVNPITQNGRPYCVP